MKIEYQITFKWKIDATIVKHEQFKASTSKGARSIIRDKLCFYWQSPPDEILVAKFVSNRLVAFDFWHWTEEGYRN